MRKLIFDTLRFLLPALIPSWRFFKTVQPSPRIEWRCPDHDLTWQIFRPRPDKLTARGYMQRIFWNPNWNETLFMVSCAERLTANLPDRSEAEILECLRFDLPADLRQQPLQFRLRFTCRLKGTLVDEITYTSAKFPGQSNQVNHGI